MRDQRQRANLRRQGLSIVVLALLLLTILYACVAAHANESHPNDLAPANENGKCVTLDGIKALNAMFAPTYVQLDAVKLALARKTLIERGAVWPDTIVVVWLAHVETAPDMVFAYAMDAHGCMVYALHFSESEMAIIFGPKL